LISPIKTIFGDRVHAKIVSSCTVAFVVADIEQTTRDFILKRLTEEVKGHPFAHFVAHLLETMGYRTHTSPEGPDGQPWYRLLDELLEVYLVERALAGQSEFWYIAIEAHVALSHLD